MSTDQSLEAQDHGVDKVFSSPTLSYDSSRYQVLPPRTGTLRVNYYRRGAASRAFPESCSTGIGMLGCILFSMGLILLEAKNVTSTSILTSSMVFSCGMVEIIMGIWAMIDNNVWGATFMVGYGAFFMSHAAINTNFMNMRQDYDTAEDWNNAYGMYLLGWTFFTWVLWTATLKSTIPIFALMTLLTLFFIFYDIYVFNGVVACKKIAGVLAVLMGIGCFYGTFDALNFPASRVVVSPEKWLIMPGNRAVPTNDKYVEVI